MSVYEITIDAEQLQQMKAQYEEINGRARHLLTCGKGGFVDVVEAIEALLRVYDAHCESEADAGFIAPDGAAAAIDALVAHYGAGRVRALIDRYAKDAA